MSPDRDWAKKAKFDLRWDKTKILKEKLKEKIDAEGPQLHLGNEAYGAKVRKCADKVDWKKFKQEVMRKLEFAVNLGKKEKRKILRKLEGQLSYVLTLNGHFDSEEADKIADFFIDCRKNETVHPLQFREITAPTYKYYPTKNMKRVIKATLTRGSIFYNRTLKAALAKKGFFLNIGLFSASESLTLMKNYCHLSTHVTQGEKAL